MVAMLISLICDLISPCLSAPSAGGLRYYSLSVVTDVIGGIQVPLQYLRESATSISALLLRQASSIALKVGNYINTEFFFAILFLVSAV